MELTRQILFMATRLLAEHPDGLPVSELWPLIKGRMPDLDEQWNSGGASSNRPELALQWKSADPGQRITARELAELLDLPGALNLSEAELAANDDHADVDEHEARFFQQLGDARGPQAAGAVSRLLDWWRDRGGEVQFGRSAGASCAPFVRHGGETLTMVRFYSRTVEVPFGTLKKRVPFSDPILRDELRRRFNDAPGVELPAAKLELYPSFEIDLMADEAVWDVVVACLDWFTAQTETDGGPSTT